MVISTTPDPGKLGFNTEKLARAVDLVRACRASAQLCLMRHGRYVLDLAIDCQPDSLFWIFSASKPYIAILTHHLAARGQLMLDAPVASYWPEFAAHGKDKITVRHVLQYRSGIWSRRLSLGEVLSLTNWRRAIRRIEQSVPVWPAGQAPAYQPLMFGFILGEVVQRVTRRPVAEVLAAELLGPLHVRDTYLGLPDAQWGRHVPLVAPGAAGWLAGAILNRRSLRAAVIPAAGISTTARDLARFYLMLLENGRVEGRTVVSQAAIEAARVPSNEGEFDVAAKRYMRWSNGFQLGGPRRDPHSVPSLGRLSHPTTFGHNGSNCCIGWADPDRDLVFTYLTNRLPSRAEGSRHLAQVADAIFSACDGD